jgi:hypothetical protein
LVFANNFSIIRFVMMRSFSARGRLPLRDSDH